MADPSNADFSPTNVAMQVYKMCVNVASAYKSRAPKLLFYVAGDHTYRLASAQEIRNGTASHGESPQHVPERDDDELVDGSAETTFAIEADLQRYLVRNLGLLEKGLTLFDNNQATEYQLVHRRIDILAKDVAGIPVIVELKLAKGLYPVLGQVLHYRALLKEQLKTPRVRVMVVASEISDDLRISASEVGDITLFEYNLSMQVSKVNEVS